MKAGLIYRYISRIPEGAELVAASILSCLKRSGFKTFLLSGKKFDAASFTRNFEASAPIDQELILPFWTQNAETYLEILFAQFCKTLL